MIEGLVVKSYGKLCNVKVDNLTYKCEVRGKYKLSNKFSNPVVSGDKVEISIYIYMVEYIRSYYGKILFN